ncbi:MAG: M20/M25/M40 family metallo-hydrolase [Chloroflexota bacterium]|nr:MAG: M20/M25/M40 family metallo-hydrolase [Chloroflexota bacterium]
MIDIGEVLKQLSETPGPSGYEGPVADALEALWSPFVDAMKRDRVGSLLATKHGEGDEPRPKILLAAHMDEIGLMVKQIVQEPDETGGNGFLRVTSVGGVDVRHLFGQMVVVHGTGEKGGDAVGIMGALPARMLPEPKRSKAFDFEDLVVDIGSSYEQLLTMVNVGDFISFRQPMRELLNRRVTGKALDNRASLAAMTVCLEYLRGRRHSWDVIAVATAQEETSLLGAFTSAFAEEPEAAIAIDVTFGKGPGATGELAYELGGGPAIGLGPNFHPGMIETIKEAARALEMKAHDEPQARPGGTDAYALQIARQGIPTGLVSIPLRYMHTMVESVALVDIERTGRLLGEFVARLDGSFLDRIAREMMDDE